MLAIVSMKGVTAQVISLSHPSAFKWIFVFIILFFFNFYLFLLFLTNININTFITHELDWVMGLRPIVSRGPIGGVPSMGVLLRDSSPYLGKLWRKPLKTKNNQVEKWDRDMNTSPPPRLSVLRAEPLGHWWGSMTDE